MATATLRNPKLGISGNTPTRTGEVLRELGDLMQVSEQAQKLVALLAERLAPVMSNLPRADTQVEDRMEPVTQLGKGLSEMNIRFSRVNEQLHDMLNRLEL